MRIFSFLILLLVCGMVCFCSAGDSVVPNAVVSAPSLPCVAPDVWLPAGELTTESCRKVEPQQNQIAVRRSGEEGAIAAASEIPVVAFVPFPCRISGGISLLNRAVSSSGDSYSPLIPRAGPVV